MKNLSFALTVLWRNLVHGLSVRLSWYFRRSGTCVSDVRSIEFRRDAQESRRACGALEMMLRQALPS